MGETTKYDVAVLGLWWSSNYGSIMTYYSLYLPDRILRLPDRDY